MSTEGFGRMVEEAMRQQGLSLRRLGARMGELEDGRVVDATILKRVVEGRRRNVDTLLAWRLIEELHLDPIRAAEAAGVWPPGVDADDLREFARTAKDVMPGSLGTVDELERRRRDRRQRDRLPQPVAA